MFCQTSLILCIGEFHTKDDYDKALGNVNFLLFHVILGFVLKINEIMSIGWQNL